MNKKETILLTLAACFIAGFISELEPLSSNVNVVWNEVHLWKLITLGTLSFYTCYNLLSKRDLLSDIWLGLVFLIKNKISRWTLLSVVLIGIGIGLAVLVRSLSSESEKIDLTSQWGNINDNFQSSIDSIEYVTTLDTTGTYEPATTKTDIEKAGSKNFVSDPAIAETTEAQTKSDTILTEQSDSVEDAEPFRSMFNDYSLYQGGILGDSLDGFNVESTVGYKISYNKELDQSKTNPRLFVSLGVYNHFTGKWENDAYNQFVTGIELFLNVENYPFSEEIFYSVYGRVKVFVPVGNIYEWNCKTKLVNTIYGGDIVKIIQIIKSNINPETGEQEFRGEIKYIPED
jgi:hypothetical protein